MNTGEARKKAEEMLPCIGDYFNGRHCGDGWHSHRCKARLQPVIAIALLELAQGEYERGRVAGLEEAARIANDAHGDEEYGHAAFRCVQIEQSIRALISTVPVEQSPRPSDLTTAITALRHYCAQRGAENEKRAITAYGAEASWHSAKAETYRRIESRLDEILATPPVTTTKDDQ